MTSLGIDPGKSGALAILREGGTFENEALLAATPAGLFSCA